MPIVRPPLPPQFVVTGNNGFLLVQFYVRHDCLQQVTLALFVSVPPSFPAFAFFSLGVHKVLRTRSSCSTCRAPSCDAQQTAGESTRCFGAVAVAVHGRPTPSGVCRQESSRLWTLQRRTQHHAPQGNRSASDRCSARDGPDLAPAGVRGSYPLSARHHCGR